MVEELLEFFIGEINAKLFEGVEFENFKTSNIEDTDEAGSFSGCFVKWFINSIYDPLEKFLVKGLWKGFNNKINFIFWLSFGDIFTTDLNYHDLLHWYPLVL